MSQVCLSENDAKTIEAYNVKTNGKFNPRGNKDIVSKIIAEWNQIPTIRAENADLNGCVEKLESKLRTLEISYALVSKKLHESENIIKSLDEVIKITQKTSYNNQFWKELIIKEIIEMDFKELDLLDENNYLKSYYSDTWKKLVASDKKHMPILFSAVCFFIDSDKKSKSIPRKHLMSSDLWNEKSYTKLLGEVAWCNLAFEWR
jgi:hypothetical protein